MVEILFNALQTFYMETKRDRKRCKCSVFGTLESPALLFVIQSKAKDPLNKIKCAVKWYISYMSLFSLYIRAVHIFVSNYSFANFSK